MVVSACLSMGQGLMPEAVRQDAPAQSRNKASAVADTRAFFSHAAHSKNHSRRSFDMTRLSLDQVVARAAHDGVVTRSELKKVANHASAQAAGDAAVVQALDGYAGKMTYTAYD